MAHNLTWTVIQVQNEPKWTPLEMRCENSAQSSLLDLCSLVVNLYEAPARSKHKVTDIRMSCVTSASAHVGRSSSGAKWLGRKKKEREGGKRSKKCLGAEASYKRAGSPPSWWLCPAASTPPQLCSFSAGAHLRLCGISSVRPENLTLIQERSIQTAPERTNNNQ